MVKGVRVCVPKEIAILTKSVTFKRVAVLTVAMLDGKGRRVLVVNTVWLSFSKLYSI